MRSRAASVDVEIIRRRGFYEFVKRAWPIVETASYVDNWHIEEKCNHCQAITEGKIRDLIINEPPGCTKSLIVSVLWHPWAWTVRPELRWIFGSFDPGLALRDAERAFKLITDPWYVERWGNLMSEQGGRFAMGDYENKHGGFRFSTSVHGKGTGRHCHVRVFDDPIKPLDVEGTTKAVSSTLEKTNNWWRNTMASRRADPSDFASVGVMQRLHENDLSAECIRDGYEHLCFPMHFDPTRAAKTSIGGDRRSQPGELLWPARFPISAVGALEKSMGGNGGPVATAQLEQSPAPPGGLIFKDETFQYFTLNEAPPHESFLVISVDCSFKDVESADGVAIEVWGAIGAKYYLYESIHEIMGFWATIEALKNVILRYDYANAILVEGKANGDAVIETFRKALSNVLDMNPKTSKLGRAHASNVYYQARSVFHLADAPWLGRKETNLKHFPKGRRDDDVDATTMALLYLANQSMTDFSAAMDQFKKEQATGTWQTELARHFSIS